MHAIPCADVEAKWPFGFPESHKGGPWQIKHVLPPELAYAAFVTEFSLPGLDVAYSDEIDFAQRRACRTFFSLDDFVDRAGPFVEGAKYLPPELLEFVRERTVGACYVRCRPSRRECHAWTAEHRELLAPGSDLLDLPVTFGDFDFFDDGGSWYLYTCDDAPVIYVASAVKAVEDLLSASRPRGFALSSTSRYYR